MVNKAIVGILVLIVLTSLGVGVLIGTQLGGGDGGADTPADGSDGGDGAGDGGDGSDGDGGDATTTATNGTAANGTAASGTATSTSSATETAIPTPTPTATATPTATPTPTQTTISAYEFDTAQIEREMIEDINRVRSQRGLAAFNTGTTTWGQLRGMTRVHARAMAEERRAVFEINGNTTEERYRGADLYDRCKYQDPDGGYIVTPRTNFQAVGSTIAGREYQDDGGTRFNANESQVAQAIVTEWFDSSTHRRPLVNDGTEIAAVGVSITDDGRVYASAAICS